MSSAESASNGDRIGKAVRTGWADTLRRSLSETDTLVIARFERISAQDLGQLRRKLQQAEASLHTVKNSLCRIVFRDLGWDQLGSMLDGTCGVAPIRGDASQVAKLLAQFSKGHEGFTVQGGLLGGRPLAAREFDALAKLPGRPALLTQMIGGVQAPLTGLLGTLQGLQRKLVGVIHAIAKKSREDGTSGTE